MERPHEIDELIAYFMNATQIPLIGGAQPSERKIDPAEAIYQAYPYKVGKPAALRAIRKQLKNHHVSILLSKTQAFAKARNGDMEFCPHCSTFFNQERFNDDPSTWIPKKSYDKNTPKPNARNNGVVGNLADNASKTAEFVRRQQTKPNDTL